MQNMRLLFLYNVANYSFLIYLKLGSLKGLEGTKVVVKFLQEQSVLP